MFLAPLNYSFTFLFFFFFLQLHKPYALIIKYIALDKKIIIYLEPFLSCYFRYTSISKSVRWKITSHKSYAFWIRYWKAKPIPAMQTTHGDLCEGTFADLKKCELWGCRIYLSTFPLNISYVNIPVGVSIFYLKICMHETCLI